MIQIVENKIDTDSVLQSVFDDNAGANLLFLGTTRRWTGEVETKTLTYECYPGMAEQQIQLLCHQAKSKWPLLAVSVVHRIGIVPVGESSMAVAVSSAHRLDAFEAGSWIIDELKKVVPIWKQELGTDGTTEWVHPTQADATNQESQA